jgi:Tol biopolymer transport system component
MGGIFLYLRSSQRKKLGKLLKVVLILSMLVGIISPAAHAALADNSNDTFSLTADTADFLEMLDGLDTQPQPHSYQIEMAETDGLVRVTEAVYATVNVTKKVSINKDGGAADGESRFAAVSEDGRWVAFASKATNLVDGDTNGVEDVFLRDMQTLTTKRISVGPDGVQANNGSYAPVMSMDGRYVLFSSKATNLLDTADINGMEDLYIYDHHSGSLRRVAEDVDAGWMYAYYRPYAISANGQIVAFASYSSNGTGDAVYTGWNMYWKNIATNETRKITDQASARSWQTSRVTITPDGRFVAFASEQRDLVPDDTNGKRDIFVYDAELQTLERVSVSSTGAEADKESEGAAISADGRFVAFSSYAENLSDRDTEYNLDIYVHDRWTKSTELISKYINGESSTGANEIPSISADGRWVVFYSYDDLYPNARYVNVYRYDRITGITELVSAAPTGVPGSNDSMKPAVSWNGKYTVFESAAIDLLPEPEDEDYVGDIYIRELALYDADQAAPVWGPGASLTAAQVGGSYVALEWAPAHDDTSQLYYKVYLNGMLQDIVQSTKYLATGLSLGTEYSFTVVPGDVHYNWSSEELQLRAVTLPGHEKMPPAMPAGIQTEPMLGGATVRWTAPADLDFTASQVKWKNRSAVVYKASAILPKGKEGLELTGLVNGEEYDIAVAAYDADGNRSESTPVTVKLPSGKKISRASVSSNGVQGNGNSYNPDISYDGRFVVFASEAKNLDGEEHTSGNDIFLMDRITEQVQIISKSTTGGAANGFSSNPKISGNGRFIVFVSSASNLVEGDTADGYSDIFLYDRDADGDGAFDTPGGTSMKKISRMEPGTRGFTPGHSQSPDMNFDGSVITFTSRAGLVSGHVMYIASTFIYDRTADQLALLQLADATAPNSDTLTPAISADGQYIAFATQANNIDPTDTDSYEDVYLYHVPTKLVKRISPFPGGRGTYEPVISADGRYVAFIHEGTNYLKNVYLYDRDAAVSAEMEKVTLVSRSTTGGEPGASSEQPAISPDGRFIAFVSGAQDIYEQQSSYSDDIFLYDRETGNIKVVNKTYQNQWLQSEGATSPVISEGGVYVAFSSGGSQYVSGDTNGMRDIFVVAVEEPLGEDTVPPSFPAGSIVQAEQIGADFVTLSWTAAIDDRAISGYSIYNGTMPIAAVPNANPRWSVTGLQPGTQYTLTVKAIDTSGNESAEGLDVTITTSATLDVRIQEIRTVLEQNSKGYASVEGTLQLEVEGTPGGTAKAVVQLAQADGSSYQFDIPLKASAFLSTVYTGSYVIPEGIVQVEQVRAELTVGDQTVILDKPLNVNIGGSLRLLVEADDPARLSHAILTVRDDELAFLDEYRLTGNGEVIVKGLPSGHNYRAEVRNSLGQQLALRNPDQLFTSEAGVVGAGSVKLKVLARASYKTGGNAEVVWTIPFGEAGHDGFAIYRRSAGDAAAIVAGTVGPTDTRFTDSGLAISTAYTYFVNRTFSSGAEEPFSNEVSLTTPGLATFTDKKFTAKTQRFLQKTYAELGSPLQVQFRTEPNRTGSMLVTFKSWHDESGKLLMEPVQRTEEVAMAPAPNDSSLYQGSFELKEGIAEIIRVKLVAKDANNNTKEENLDGFPLPVSGLLKVSVGQLPSDYNWGHGRVAITTSGIPASQIVLAGGGEVVLTLPPGSDHSYKITGSAGQVLWSKTNVTVTSGLVTVTSTEPQARVQIMLKDPKDPQAEGIPGVKYRVEGIRGSIGEGTTGRDGLIAISKTLFVGESITLTTDMTNQPVYNSFHRTFELTEETNIFTVTPEAKPYGLLKGKVLDIAGNPTSQAVVHVYNARFRTAVEVNGDGYYEMRVPLGDVTVEAVSKSNKTIKSKSMKTTIAEGETVLDAGLLPAEAKVHINIYTKLPEGTWQGPLDLDWRVASHFRMRPSHTIIQHGLPTIVRAQEGDLVNICVDGQEAGLPAGCGMTSIDEDRTGTVNIYLESKGGIVAGTIANPTVYVPAYYQGELYSVDELGQLKFVRRFSLPRTGFSIDIPSKGSYRLLVHNQSQARVAKAVSFQIAEGESKSLGEIVLEIAGRFSGQSGTSMQVVSGAATPNSTVQVRVTYANTGSPTEDVEQAKLKIELPEKMNVKPGTVVVNGRPGTFNVEGRTVIIPVGDVARDMTGSVQLQLSLGDVGYMDDLALAARMEYAAGGVEQTEQLGIVPVELAAVTLNAPSDVANLLFTVSGKAPSGSTVTVFDGILSLGQTIASPSGAWNLIVELNRDMPGVNDYRLRAQTMIGDQAVSSNEVTVTYDPEAAILTEIAMMQADGRRVTFNPQEGVAKFPYVVLPGSPFLFELRFSDVERISHVTVQMGENIALAQRVDGVYKATIKTTAGIGPIWVDYKVMPKWKKNIPEEIPTMEQFREGLPPSVRDFTIDSVETPDEVLAVLNGSSSIATTSAIQATITGDLKTRMQYTVERIAGYEPTAQELQYVRATGLPAYSPAVEYAQKGDKLDIQFGIMIPASELQGEDGMAIATSILAEALYPTGLQQSSRAVAPTALPSADMIKLTLKLTLQGLPGNIDDIMKVIDNLKAMKDIAGASKLFEKATELHEEARKLCDPKAAKFYTEWAESIVTMIMVHEFIKWSMMAGGLVAGAGTLGFGTVVAYWLTNQLAEQVLDRIVEEDLASLEQYIKVNKCFKPPEPPKRKPKGDPKYIWDPSGYVYEGIPNNRVRDVKATALEQDPVTKEWNVWDAEWYEQINPHYTNGEGRYGWDVPEGRWKVKYEKEGYDTVYSHEMDVPPPHFDVNIPIVSYLSPEVTYVVSRPGGASVDIYFTKPVDIDQLPENAVKVEGAGALEAGSVQAIEPVEMPNGRTLAMGIRFVPEQALALGQTYTVTVNGMIPSYAGIPLESDIVRTITATGADVTAPEEARAITDGLTEDSISFIWEKPAEPDFAKVRIAWKKSTEAGYSSLVEVPKGTNWAVIEGLQTGNTYEFRISTVDDSDNESAGVTLTREFGVVQSIDISAPQAVFGFRVKEIGSDRISLEWVDPTAPDLEKLKLSWKAAGSTTSPQTVEAAKGVQTVTITGLAANMAYEVGILAIDASGNASGVNTIAVTTKAATSGGGVGGGGGGGGGPIFGPGPAAPAGEAEWIVGDKQEVFEAFEGLLSLAMKKDSLAVGSKIVIRKGKETEAPQSFRRLSSFYSIDFGTETQVKPKNPITLALKYSKDQAASVNPARIGIFKRDSALSSGWRYVGGVVIPSKQQVKANIAESGEYVVMVYERSFVDLAGHWSRSDIEVLASRMIVNGVTEREFEPDRAITRAEFTKLLVETMAGVGNLAPASTDSGFFDVLSTDWYASYVGTAAKYGLVQGSDGKFRPNDPVTREEMAVILSRAEAWLSGTPTVLSEHTSLTPFEDQDHISEWAKNAMADAVRRGLLQGMTETAIEPKTAATRAQAGIILLRLMATMGYITE